MNMSLRNKIFFNYQKNKTSGINNGLSSFCHFSSSSSTLGYLRLQIWKKKPYSYLKFIIHFLKHFLAIGYQSQFTLIKKKNNLNFNKLIITWAYKKNFLKDGSLEDRYFSYNSKKNKKFLWLVLYLDKKLPRKIGQNIILYKINKTKFNFLYLIKVFFKTLIVVKFNINKLIHYLSSSSNLAVSLIHDIKNQIDFSKINCAITPFEGQPFQQYFFSFLQKNYKLLKTIGYLSHTHPLQFDIFYREGSPSQLLTHSPDQKKYIQSNLGWPKKRIKLISSMRFLKKNKKNQIVNKILFPYDYDKIEILLHNFENFLVSCKNKSLPYFSIKTHPAPYNLEKQTKLKIGIRNLIKKYNLRFNKKLKKNVCIVLGLSSSVVFALEKKIQVIHVTDDYILETFDKKIWPSITTQKLSNEVLLYKLKYPGKCILFGKHQNTLEKNL